MLKSCSIRLLTDTKVVMVFSKKCSFFNSETAATIAATAYFAVYYVKEPKMDQIMF